MGKAHLDALANLTLRCNRNEPICFSLIRASIAPETWSSAGTSASAC
jgi:hypothetical protein